MSWMKARPLMDVVISAVLDILPEWLSPRAAVMGLQPIVLLLACARQDWPTLLPPHASAMASAMEGNLLT